MCTVSAIGRREGGVRLVCNRDERPDRPTDPPRRVRCGAQDTLMPIDREAGGTWISVNERGLIFTLLNRTPRSPVANGAVSRGLIIPGCAGAANLDEVAQRLQQLHSESYSPFRLLVIDDSRILEAESVGGISLRWWVLDRPLMRTSSGLGDHVVERPRASLFAAMVGHGGSTADQDAFHDHSWPDHPETSVMMARHDARTVSQTTVEVSPSAISMRYRTRPVAHTDTTETLVHRPRSLMHG